MTRLLLLTLLLGLPTTFALGCSDADTAIDCGSICNRYKDCFDTDYDADACADRCENDAKDDRDYRDRADTCHACIDDRSCTGSFVCSTDCVGVVP